MEHKINIIKKSALHKVPSYLQKIITSSVVKTTWDGLTPLGQNEWICWIESAKRSDTRIHRIKRMCEEILKGKQRPCCWAGCIHR